MATVYIVRAIGVLRIKIGITTDLDRRLSELRGMSPVPLEVVATMDGVEFNAETTIHGIMHQYHSHGEWFHEDGLSAALRWIEIVKAAAKNVAVVIVDRFPQSEIPDAIAAFRKCGAANIANELTNLTGQSVMDRRYG